VHTALEHVVENLNFLQDWISPHPKGHAF